MGLKNGTGCVIIIKHPGVVQLVARLLWECRDCIRVGGWPMAGSPYDTDSLEGSPECGNAAKRGLDHRSAHRQEFFPKLKK